MGLLVEGKWSDEWYDTKSTQGHFVRQESSFRHWVTPNGEAGVTGKSGFKAEPDRYHLYISLACPWAHRTLIMRQLKGLQALVSLSVVSPIMKDGGWSFTTYDDDSTNTADDINHSQFLYQIYQLANPEYTGRVTVPVLWDKKLKTIVSNESSEITRMFNSAFNQVGALGKDYYPKYLRNEIDEWNDFIYPKINNGVYRAGFATSQEAYEAAVLELFNALEKLDKHLSKSRYLLGNQITEADWRLFTTLVRFDAVYVGHFKCNLHRIIDYPSLWGYVRDLYQQPGIADTVNLQQIKQHYYASHVTINPTGIVPAGPDINFWQRHQRAQLSAKF